MSAWDEPGTLHGREMIARVELRRWLPWRRHREIWRSSCACGWEGKYLDAGTAGRALAQHRNYDALVKGL